MSPQDATASRHRKTPQHPFRPLLPDVQHILYGDTDALAEVLESGRDHCVVVEPVQGEGGVIVPPPGDLREIERLCRQHDALFVLDEIQTGLGRLGHWWGADREQATPTSCWSARTSAGE